MVSVSGSSTQREWTDAKVQRGRRSIPRHAVSATVVRPGAVARPWRGATGAVPATWRWPVRATANGQPHDCERTRTVPLNTLSDLFHATHDRS